MLRIFVFSTLGGREGLADLLESQAKTAKIINDVLDEESRLRLKHRQNEEEHLKLNYPILSRINSWMKRNLNHAMVEYVEKYLWRPHQEAISR